MSPSEFLDIAKSTGVDITESDGVTIWSGGASGKRKARGPLAGKEIALLVAAEFSDFQAYYLAEYISEMGGRCTFVGAEGPKWKNTRPTSRTKGVQGMWGVSLPIPVLESNRAGYKPLAETSAEGIDALVVLGGHSSDLLQTEKQALDLIQAVHERGGAVGAIGDASLSLLPAKVHYGKRVTGNHIVRHLLERIGEFVDEPAVRDGNLITARDTLATPAFLRELCRWADPAYEDPLAGVLRGKRIVVVAGEDFEDIEMIAPLLEFLHRGAELTLATFPPPMRARPPLLGLDVVLGSFGASVPLQEIPADRYRIRPLQEITPNELDLVMIPGAFCPWNMVAAGGPVEWLKSAHDAGVNLAAICHGAIPLAAADIVAGRKLAGVGACKDHIDIMGGTFNGSWSAVVDQNFVTGRVPSDVPEFVDAITYRLLR